MSIIITREHANRTSVFTTILHVFFFVLFWSIESPNSVQAIDFTTPLTLSQCDRQDLEEHQRFVYMGGIVLDRTALPQNQQTHFGGFSALSVTSDGNSFKAITDSGHYLRGQLNYANDGQLRAIQNASWNVLHGGDNSLLLQVEAIAHLASGSIAMSIEDRAVIQIFDTSLTSTRSVPLPQNFVNSQNTNKNVEAITELPDGRLLLISEGVRGGNATMAQVTNILSNTTSSAMETVAVRLYNPVQNSWLRLRYLLRDSLVSVGATTLPNGDVLVLEVRWFRNEDRRTEIRLVRVRASHLSSPRVNALLIGEELGHFGEHNTPTIDRYEGISARVDQQGFVWIYLISDDNWPTLRNSNQRNILLVLRTRAPLQ